MRIGGQVDSGSFWDICTFMHILAKLKKWSHKVYRSKFEIYKMACLYIRSFTHVKKRKSFGKYGFKLSVNKLCTTGRFLHNFEVVLKSLQKVPQCVRVRVRVYVVCCVHVCNGRVGEGFCRPFLQTWRLLTNLVSIEVRVGWILIWNFIDSKCSTTNDSPSVLYCNWRIFKKKLIKHTWISSWATAGKTRLVMCCVT